MHDEEGIECMRASGRLAAQVLEYAGTLVKVTVTLARESSITMGYFSSLLFSSYSARSVMVELVINYLYA